MERGWILPVGGMYLQAAGDMGHRLLPLIACTIPPEELPQNGARRMAV